MSSTIFACKPHLCKCPNYSYALMKQSNKIPPYKQKMLAFGDEIGFGITVHHPKIISTSKNWFLQLDRFWKQNMLLKVPTLISSFSGVECTLTELFRRFLTGGLAVVIFFLNIVPEASGNNLTTPPHASYDCEDVSHYYSSLECLKEEELMEKMHVIISPHHSIPYKQVWDALRELDAVDIEHPNDSPNVIEIYSQKAVPKALAGKLEGWNSKFPYYKQRNKVNVTIP
ncbi:uncharacterized protein LOC131039538 [Cryptomeria japonica]|uniref:uncharacterized protein LOC131039538 n=1 Tax=Cryptomeria japonica TaxID=3369 RepID=UPI0027DA7959|nr:uncharacterized protein LOC131039538 [Cryptomeria japonica]